MTLAERLERKTQEINNIKQIVEEEILESFKKYIQDGKLEKFIEKNTDNSEISASQKKLYFNFWAYQSGCSTTHFRFGGWIWETPGEEKYSYSTHRYKGITLSEIQENVLEKIVSAAKRNLEDMGFFVSSLWELSKNNLGYIDDYITISW